MVAGFVVTVVSCVGIGAWLVVQGHPWFALLAMLIGASTHMKQSDGICRSSGTDSD